HGLDHLLAVLGADDDRLVAERDPLVADRRRNFPVDISRDAHNLGQVEVVGGEVFELPDKPVSVRSGDADVLFAEVGPIDSLSSVQFLIPNVPQALYMGRGGLTGHQRKGLLASDPLAELEHFIDWLLIENFRIAVHSFSKKRY